MNADKNKWTLKIKCDATYIAHKKNIFLIASCSEKTLLLLNEIEND